MNESQRPWSNLGVALLLVLSLGGMALVVLGTQRWIARQNDDHSSGLDVDTMAVGRPAVMPVPDIVAPSPYEGADIADPEPVPGKVPMGSVGMLRAGSLSIAQPGPVGSTAPNPAAATASRAGSLTAAVRNSESRYEALGVRYTNKYLVIRQYGADWMRYSDLKRFNDEYMEDHDPIKFARNVAASPNFAALVKKYAARPEIRGFLVDAVKTAPGELTRAAQEYLGKDNNAAALLRRFTDAVGLPGFLVAGLTGGKLDGPQAASALLKSNPQLNALMRLGAIDPERLDSNLRPSRNPSRSGDR